MSGYVVCPACGTRIKAGRGHCLRCFEPLPDPDVPVRPPIWESLGLSRDKQMMIVAGASLLAVGLLVVIWRTSPGTTDDQVRPAAAAPRSRAAAAPSAAPAAPAPAGAGAETAERAPLMEPVTVAEPRPVELTPAERADLESTRAAYEQALDKTPDDSETLNGLGQILLRLNRPDEAIVRFERAIALAPARAAYHLNLARAASDLDRQGRAVEEYREAVRLLPKDAAARYTLGLALQKYGDHQAAVAEFERAIALSPANAAIYLAYAASLDHLERSADALREYRHYLDIRPTAPEAESVRSRIQALRPAQP